MKEEKITRRQRAEKILLGMTTCLPVTEQEDIGCGKCPYAGPDCEDKMVSLPWKMTEDIKALLRDLISN